MHASMLNIKNVRKDIEKFINILEKYIYEKAVFQRYFLNILLSFGDSYSKEYAAISD